MSKHIQNCLIFYWTDLLDSALSKCKNCALGIVVLGPSLFFLSWRTDSSRCSLIITWLHKRLCDIQVTHPFLTNAFILTSIYFHDSCKINITSGISAHRTESDKSKIQLLKAGLIPRLLPVKGEPLPNDMISLNPLFVPQAVESTRVFHSVVMTGLFADEREQRPVKPATHRLVWLTQSWETEWRRRMIGSQTDDRRLWIFFPSSWLIFI